MLALWNVIKAPFVFLWTMIEQMCEALYYFWGIVLHGIGTGIGFTVGFLIVIAVLNRCSHRVHEVENRLVKVEVTYDAPEEK